MHTSRKQLVYGAPGNTALPQHRREAGLAGQDFTPAEGERRGALVTATADNRLRN